MRSRNLCILKVTSAKVNLTQAEFQHQQHVPINWADQPGVHCISLTNKRDVLVGSIYGGHRYAVSGVLYSVLSHLPSGDLSGLLEWSV